LRWLTFSRRYLVYTLGLPYRGFVVGALRISTPGVDGRAGSRQLSNVSPEEAPHMNDLRNFSRRGPMQAGALTFALALATGAWAQSSATAPAPSASSAAAAERAQAQSDRTLYWIRVLADKPATKAAAAAPAAPKPAPAPALAARPAAEMPRVAQAPAPAPAPAPASRPPAPATVAASTDSTAANLSLGARGGHEPAPTAGTVATGAAAGAASSVDASPAVGGALAAPALTAPALDVPPQEPPEEPDPGLVMVHSVDPEFPMNLMRRLRKGEVEVRFEVGADGQVETVSVEKSTHHGLDAAALEAVRQWRFKPGPRGHTALVDLAFNMDS
jgi:protein TonB